MKEYCGRRLQINTPNLSKYSQEKMYNLTTTTVNVVLTIVIALTSGV